MARDRRMICRSSFTSKKLAKCTDAEHLLFYGLILNADDEGRGDGDPVTLTFFCGNRRWSKKRTEQMMDKLRTLKLVSWYTADGNLYYEVTDFDRYQQGSWQGKHKKSSLIPKMSEEGHRVRCTRTPESEKSVAKLMECNGMESVSEDDTTTAFEDEDPTPIRNFLAHWAERIGPLILTSETSCHLGDLYRNFESELPDGAKPTLEILTAEIDALAKKPPPKRNVKYFEATLWGKLNEE